MDYNKKTLFSPTKDYEKLCDKLYFSDRYLIDIQTMFYSRRLYLYLFKMFSAIFIKLEVNLEPKVLLMKMVNNLMVENFS